MKMIEDIIIKPIITEESMDMLDAKKYVFKVQSSATKSDIAAAVEEMFKVKVASVNTINMKRNRETTSMKNWSFGVSMEVESSKWDFGGRSIFYTQLETD